MNSPNLSININGTFGVRREENSVVVDLSSANTNQFWLNVSRGAKLVGGAKTVAAAVDETKKTLRFPLAELQGKNPLQLLIRDQPVAEFTITDDGLEATQNHSIYQLSVAETRCLSHPLNLEFLKKSIPYDREARRGFDPKKHAPITDLHTHFSSQLRAADLFDIALKADKNTEKPKEYVTYPVGLLKLLDVTEEGQSHLTVPSFEFTPMQHEGLACEKKGASCEAVRLRDLTENQRKAIIKAMDTSEDKTKNFQDVEREIYRFANPLMKNPRLTKAMLRRIAEDYAANGIEYAELATSGLLDPQWFQAMVEAVDEIENGDHPVRTPDGEPFRMRFLVGLARKKSPEETMPILERMKFLARHPYVAGIDLMGNETTKTSDFHWALSHMAMWAQQSENSDLKAEHGWNFQEDFLIRLHAGEMAKNPNNVRDAINIAFDNKVRVRVGHGQNAELDGSDIGKLRKMQTGAGKVDDKTKKTNPNDWFGFEICPDSNQFYGMAQLVHNVVINDRRRFSHVVLGSDGNGMVHTSPRQLAYSALATGVSLDQLKEMRDYERGYIDRQTKRDERKTNAFHQHYAGGNAQFCDAYAKFNPKQVIDARFVDKKPILIGGASGESWKMLSKLDHRYIEQMMQLLVATLDPEKVYFVLGRVKNDGVSQVLDKAIRQHNSKPPYNKFQVMGRYAGTKDAPMGELAESVSGLEYIPGSIDEVPDSMAQYVRKRGGKALFFGGKNFTADMMKNCQDEGKVPVPSAAYMPKGSVMHNQMAEVTPPQRHIQNPADMLRVLRETGEGNFCANDDDRAALLRDDVRLNDVEYCATLLEKAATRAAKKGVSLIPPDSHVMI